MPCPFPGMDPFPGAAALLERFRAHAACRDSERATAPATTPVRRPHRRVLDRHQRRRASAPRPAGLDHQHLGRLATGGGRSGGGCRAHYRRTGIPRFRAADAAPFAVGASPHGSSGHGAGTAVPHQQDVSSGWLGSCSGEACGDSGQPLPFGRIGFIAGWPAVTDGRAVAAGRLLRVHRPCRAPTARPSDRVAATIAPADDLHPPVARGSGSPARPAECFSSRLRTVLVRPPLALRPTLIPAFVGPQREVGPPVAARVADIPGWRRRPPIIEITHSILGAVGPQANGVGNPSRATVATSTSPP
jgi:hypothetical protein